MPLPPYLAERKRYIEGSLSSHKDEGRYRGYPDDAHYYELFAEDALLIVFGSRDICYPAKEKECESYVGGCIRGQKQKTCHYPPCRAHRVAHYGACCGIGDGG